jgi:D-ribose pyranose/furanose isomerase RbsD
MLHYPLIHPQMLGALGTAGHGSQVLIVDGNYPHVTGVNPAATRVYLNVRPGRVTVMDVLGPVLSAIEVERATVMRPADGASRTRTGDLLGAIRATRIVPTCRSFNDLRLGSAHLRFSRFAGNSRELRPQEHVRGLNVGDCARRAKQGVLLARLPRGYARAKAGGAARNASGASAPFPQIQHWPER